MGRREGRERGGREGGREGGRRRDRGRGKGVAHIHLNKLKKRKEIEGRREEEERGGRRGPYTNSARFLVSIAFSRFSGPRVGWETTALRLS